MKRPLGYAALVIFNLLLAWTPAAQAQDRGTIAGVVVDGETGDPLPGANAVIQGTQIGGQTDLDGRFEITGLDPGTYDVRVSFVGFQAKTVTGVEVEAGETERLELSIAPEAADLGEVVVTAEAARNSEAGLLRERQRASAVSDAISAEAIGRSGSSSAADAMEKVTGASVVGGKYVYVRGLGDRYANTQVNGVDIPSADPDRNSVQFDLFPSDLLENIVTLKTFTPDKPGNFSGGLVDIGLKSYPPNLNLKFSSSVSVNTQAHFDDAFLTFPGGGLDFFGTYGGLTGLPADFDGLTRDDLPQGGDIIAQRDPAFADRLDRLSKAFDPVMGPSRTTAPLSQSYALTLGNESNVLGRPLGYVFSLTYNRDASFYSDGFYGRYEPPSAGDLPPAVLLEEERGTEEVSLGGVTNLNLRLTPNNKIGFSGLYSRTGETSALFQEGRWPREAGINDTTLTLTRRTLQYTERDLYSAQLTGEHFIERLNGTAVEWTGAYANTRQEQPDQRLFVTTRRAQRDGGVSYSAQQSGQPDPLRIFSDLSEQSYNGKLDLTVPFKQWGGQKARVKTGGAYKLDDRDYNERTLAFETASAQIVPFTGDDQTFFSDENVGIIGRQDNGDPIMGNYIYDFTRPANSYTGERTVAAGYLMLEMPITADLKAIAGARLERTDIAIALGGDTQDELDGDGRIEQTDVLPSLNLVYALGENMNVRAAATRTLARPTFREISPVARFDLETFNFVIGNPDLERTLITNADLRWEWFTRPGEILAVSIFYKDLDQPIERVLLGSTNGQITWDNAKTATVYGAELEARKRMDFIAPGLQHLTVGGNLSLVQSEIDVLEQEQRPFSSRPLQGQSPYTLNFDVTYDNPSWGTTAGLYFNTFGERLSSVALRATPDVYEQPFAELNFTLSQQIVAGLTAKLSAKNILDDTVREVHEFEGQTYVFNEYQRGRSFSLGLSYRPF